MAPEEEAYWKVDADLPAGRLAALERTVALPDFGQMKEAAAALLEIYRSVARSLADRYEVSYPDALDRLMTDRLTGLEAG